jgi:SAM-dependent methyltransferase
MVEARGVLLNEYNPAGYGDAVGADYDLLYPETAFETEATVAALAELARSAPAGGRSILEFGIGTGRLALPLLAQGFTVAGIEGSEAMLAQLRAKPRGDEIEVIVGDFTRARVDGAFSVVALVLNGITDPPTRDAQIECFRNAARHLEPGGCFVLETYVLRPEQLSGDWSIWPRIVEKEHVELQLSRYDPATGILERTLVHLYPDSVRFVTIEDAYAWPGELDLMARMVGLRLRSRHGGWAGEPFDASSHRHVSIYERAETDPTDSRARSDPDP